MNKPKKNFVKKIKRKPNQEWETDFHLSISSKAMFKLSSEGLKLYMMLLMHGKGKYISMRTLAYRMEKSERTIQRYAEELKEKGFLRIIMIEPKKFQYLFDYRGMLNEITKPKAKETKVEFVEEEVNEEIIVVEEEQTEQDFVLEKAKTIIDYTDFAILENKFWLFDDDLKKSVIKTLENRLEKELENREAIEWFLDKTKI